MTTRSAHSAELMYRSISTSEDDYIDNGELQKKTFDKKIIISEPIAKKSINVITPDSSESVVLSKPLSIKEKKLNREKIFEDVLKLEPEEKVVPSIVNEDEDEAQNSADNDDISPKVEYKMAATTYIPPEVAKVYRIVYKTTGNLGGNGTTGAIYGELTTSSMQKVINLLKELTNLNHSSRFIDVGAGLGKPNFHAAQDPKVRLSLGIELEDIRWQLSMHNLSSFSANLISNSNNLNGGVNFIGADIEIANSFDPFTHIYMYDLGFPPPLQQSIARKFNSSVYATTLISYRPPRRVIHEYGYNVEFIAKLPTNMCGSGEVHTAYIYKRIGTIPKTPIVPNQTILKVPGRPNFQNINDNNELEDKDEEDKELVCDKAFYESSRIAVSLNPNDVFYHSSQVMTSFLNSGRKTRSCRK